MSADKKSPKLADSTDNSLSNGISTPPPLGSLSQSSPLSPTTYVIASDMARGRKVLSRLSENNLKAQMLTVKNPSELVSTVEKRTPDVLLLLYPMAQFNNFDFCRNIRKKKNLQNMKMIVLDDDPNPAKKETALNNGIDQYLPEALALQILKTKL